MPFWKRYLDRLIRWVTFYSKKEWIFVASIAAVIGLLYLPWEYRHISEQEQIVSDGVSTVGKVVSHTTPGKRSCSIRAIVEYVAEAKSYSINLQGCSADKNALPVGTPVTVWYVPGKPWVSWAKANDADNHDGSSRSWTNFVFGFIVFVIGLAVWRQYLERPPPKI